MGGQGGFEPRIEVIVIMQKKSGGGPVGGGVRVVMYEELEIIEKCTKKVGRGGGAGRERGGGGVGWPGWC